MAQFDAIVIGGGIVGASLAYHLAKAGAKTCLIDRHDEGQATDAGAGILSPETSSSATDDWYRIGMKAVKYYQPLMAALANEQAGDTGYARCGLVRVAIGEDELDTYQQAYERIFARHQDNPDTKADDLQEISPEQAQEYFPPLTNVEKAFYHRLGARVDGRLLREALTKAGVYYGLDIHKASVEKLVIRDAQVVGVEVDGEVITTGKVAIAGGAWSPHFEKQLGVHIPVIPQRGQIIHLQLENQDTADWSVIHPFRGHYIVPWDNGRIVVGATREMDSGFVPKTTAAGIHEVLGEALYIAPGLASASIVDIRVGLRPYTMDLLPILGTVPTIDNIYLATGHGASGLQLGPYSGKVIADMMLGKAIDDNLDAFRNTRFISDA